MWARYGEGVVAGGGSVPFLVVHLVEGVDAAGLVGFGEGSPEGSQVTNQTESRHDRSSSCQRGSDAKKSPSGLTGDFEYRWLNDALRNLLTKYGGGPSNIC